MTALLVWQLVWPGYIGVDGWTWHTKEECRQWAINRLHDMKKSDLPEWWQCQQVERNEPKGILERERQ